MYGEVDPFLSPSAVSNGAVRNSIEGFLPKTFIVPTDTDKRIRSLCAQLRQAKDDQEAEGVIEKLRAVLAEHIRRARSSLGVKGSLIRKMDPDSE